MDHRVCQHVTLTYRSGGEVDVQNGRHMESAGRMCMRIRDRRNRSRASELTPARYR